MSSSSANHSSEASLEPETPSSSNSRQGGFDSSILDQRGSDGRLSWRAAHDHARRTAQTPEEAYDAVRWRVAHLIAGNRIPEARTALRAFGHGYPEIDTRSIEATIAVNAGDLADAQRLASGRDDVYARCVAPLTAAHELRDDAIETVERWRAYEPDPRSISLAHELLAELHFIRGDRVAAAAAAEEAADAGSELSQGWRDCHRALIDAASLFLEARFTDFEAAVDTGLKLADDVGNHWARRRLLLLRLTLAGLRGEPGAELATEIVTLERDIPPLFKNGALAGLGAWLHASSGDVERAATTNTPSTARRCDMLIQRGYVVGLDCPISLERLAALAHVRAGRTGRARDLFTAALTRANEHGWIVSSACSVIQIAELSSVLGVSRPDTAEAEALLSECGIAPERVALAASRAHVLSHGGGGLTAREREVIDLTSQGLSAQQVADLLGLRATTVYTHLKRARRKLGPLDAAGWTASALIAERRRRGV